MNDSTEELIKEIAAKHGIVLGADDPLMILPTINQSLIADFNQALAKNLVSLHKELEIISKKWSDDAKNKAEKILNHALNASRDHIAAAMQTGIDGLPDTVRQSVRSEISGQLAPAIKKIHALLRFTLVAAGASLTGSLIMIWVVFQH